MTTFSGLEVHGEITYGEKRAKQRPEQEFLNVLQPVLNDEGITSIGWAQYTPYFNDGDPCVFSAGCLLVDLPEDADDRYEYEFPYGGYNNGEFTYPFGRVDLDTKEYVGECKDTYRRLEALNRALQSGEFDDVLLEKFGDHANVRIVPNDGIYVEFYDHD